MDGVANSPVLRTIGLTKRYGGFRAVDELSLTVTQGQIYGFLGRNGAGKTTTIRMLMGIISPTAGAFELFEESVKKPKRSHKQRIGYVSQGQHFYSWMNAKRLGRFVRHFYPTWDDERYGSLLDRFEIPSTRRVARLSGGTQVKVALALALAPRPELLILDEPTSGLDPAARREFHNIIVEQATELGHATFFSSHIVEEVERVADRVGIIDRGRLCFEGSLDELKARFRRIPMADLGPLPDGFRMLGTDRTRQGEYALVEAQPQRWSEAPPELKEAEVLSLEGSFLAMVLSRPTGEDA